jgi:hypothetical protein
MGKLKNARAEGWANAHLGSLLEDGIYARESKHSEDVPVEVVSCFPETAEFLVKFQGTTEEQSMYFLVGARLCDEEGNEL